jgi:tellurite resistance protein
MTGGVLVNTADGRWGDGKLQVSFPPRCRAHFQVTGAMEARPPWRERMTMRWRSSPSISVGSSPMRVAATSSRRRMRRRSRKRMKATENVLGNMPRLLQRSARSWRSSVSIASSSAAKRAAESRAAYSSRMRDSTRRAMLSAHSRSKALSSSALETAARSSGICDFGAPSRRRWSIQWRFRDTRSHERRRPLAASSSLMECWRDWIFTRNACTSSSARQTSRQRVASQERSGCW